MEESVKITRLELQNVKRVRAVALSPRPEGLTVIGGRNAQGKTSVLDGIAYALGGEKFRPSSLQNSDGMAPARMEVELSNGLRVVREGKNAALKVTDPTGRKAGQRLLDSFVSELAIDLPKFLGSPSAQKAKTLLQCLGIEDRLKQLDDEERKWYDERTLAGREADRKAKYAAELPEYPDAPEEPLSGKEMTKRLQDALAVNAANRAARDRLAELERRAVAAKGELERAEEAAEAARVAANSAAVRLSQAQADLDKAKSSPVGEDVDTAAISAELEQIDAVNARVRTNQEKARALDEAEQAKAAVGELSQKVEAVRTARKALLASVRMPLEGLSVEGGELVYNGRKWDCMSGMEQVRVAVCVCRMLRPGCGFVLLDRMEAFDPAQLADFGQWLAGLGMQAIATRVADDGTCDIVIEDGTVRGADDPPSPEVRFEEAAPEPESADTDGLGDW